MTAVILVVSTFAGAIPASAKSVQQNFVCGSYTAEATLVSANNKSGGAITSSANGSTKFDYLYAAMFGTEVNKSGDVVKYVSGEGSEDTNSTTIFIDAIPVISSYSTNYYAKMASAHIAMKGSAESSKALNVSY